MTEPAVPALAVRPEDVTAIGGLTVGLRALVAAADLGFPYERAT